MARIKSASLRPDLLALAIVLALSSSFASAQEAGKAAEPTKPATLEAVTVTAERRVEDIQDVPVSITAISGEKLDVRAHRADNHHHRDHGRARLLVHDRRCPDHLRNGPSLGAA